MRTTLFYSTLPDILSLANKSTFESSKVVCNLRACLCNLQNDFQSGRSGNKFTSFHSISEMLKSFEIFIVQKTVCGYLFKIVD